MGGESGRNIVIFAVIVLIVIAVVWYLTGHREPSGIMRGRMGALPASFDQRC